jgi:DNA repair exonuclease SbcCD ATPase subunit
MLTPKTLKVRGFRGFREEETFDFDKPAVILFGENRCGKSSTLNALEWCLFGDECRGKQTTIRERVGGWEIPNRDMRVPDVSVQLELRDPHGTYVVQRRLVKPGKKALVAELKLVLAAGKVVTGEAADPCLKQLLRCCSFRDFMTTVYQHQEVIRDVLTEVPKERNDAIDRVLGLSDYRNLLTGIRKADPPGWHKRIEDRFGVFEGRVSDKLADRGEQLDEKRREAAEAGVPSNRLTDKAALASAAEVRQALRAFAEEAGVEPPILEIPDSLQSLGAFEKAAEREISRLRGETPLTGEQEGLFSRQTDVLRLRKDFEDLKKVQQEIGDSLSTLGREHGGHETVKKQHSKAEADVAAAKAEYRRADAHKSLIREAIAYLEKADIDKQKGACPVCGGEAPDLLETLRRRSDETLSAQMEAIKARIERLESSEEALRRVAEQYGKADRRQKELLKERAASRRDAGELFKRELTDEDDPLALLDTELKRIKGRLEELKDAIEGRQGRLDEIAQRLEQTRLIHEILDLEEKNSFIEEIKGFPEYKEVEAARYRASEFVNDVGAIKAAVAAASNREAADKLSEAERDIDEYFRQMTGNPAVRWIRLSHKADTKTGRNDYKVTDQDGNDLAPILSQGDLNALALAIFLGLASSSADAARFGFVMLDDPSQSLGSAHKEQLVKVLDRVARWKRVILATMDGEFRDLLRGRLTKEKQEYLFDEWTPEKGVRKRPG